MQITYYGHACFGVKVNGKDLLFDPFISPNEKASAIDVNTIPADFILVSHGHEDHVADVAAIAKRTGATVVSNFEVITWFGQQGIENGHPMNHGGQWKFDFGTVKYVNAIHSSNMPDGSYGGNPGGFVIQSDEGNFYFAGDTALTLDMKLIPETGIKLDFAMLPIGDNFTMGISDAVVAAGFIDCNNIIGMHYDTFGYIVIDHDDAVRQFQAAGRSLTLLNIGESKEL